MPDPSDPYRRLAEGSRLHVSLIRRYERAGCIEVTGVTDDAAVRRVRRVHRLRRDLGLELPAIDIIVRLIVRLARFGAG